MNFVNFFVRGPSACDSYKRSAYSNDSNIKKIGDIDAFTGSITHIHQAGDTKTVYVDSAYAFATISDSVRNKCTKFWDEMESKSINTFLISGLAGIAGLTASIILYIPLPIAVAAISIAILGVSLLAAYRSSQAKRENELWEDPTKIYIENCRKHHQATQIQKETEKKVEQSKKQDLKELIKNIEENFINKLREIDPVKLSTSDVHKGYANILISSIKNFIELNIAIGAISKEQANDIVKGYPELHGMQFV